MNDETIGLFLLIHEFGHLFDDKETTGDHYTNGDTDALNDALIAQGKEAIYDDECLYGYETHDVTEPIMCAGCIERINRNSNRYDDHEM